MKVLLAWVLAAMLVLAPKRDHSRLALGIATVVATERPLFKDDEDRHRTAAVLLAIAYRESGFDDRAVGDGGHSFGAFQNHDSAGGSESLLGDPVAQARRAIAMVRISMHVCPEHPLAWYVSGPRGCENARAQRLSRDRMKMAAKLYAGDEFTAEDLRSAK